MSFKKQAQGYLGKVRVLFEESYRTQPATPEAFELPFTGAGVTAGRTLNSKSTMAGRRAPARQDPGFMDASSNNTFSANIHGAGVILKMLSGVPSSAELSENLTLSGAVSKAGIGLVRISCAGHGLRPNMLVTISGTSNYDGIYKLQPETGPDDIVIEAAFVSETLAGTETLKRGAHRNLSAGDAVDRGAGLVGLPCNGHGYVRGESISISGTTSYNGNFRVADGTGPNEIVIESAYTSEFFDGSEAVSPRFFKHIFKLGDTQPSFALEQENPLDPGADSEPVVFIDGCKVSNFSCSPSGDGQLTFTVDVSGANRRLLTESAAAADKITTFADHDFRNLDAELILGGEFQTRVTGSSIAVATNLDTSGGYVQGSGGVRACIDEGAPNLTGSLTAHYTDNSLLKKSMAGTPQDFSLGLVTGGNSLHLTYPECLLQESGLTPGINGPQGVVVEAQVQGYQDSNPYGTCFMAELVNTWPSY